MTYFSIFAHILYYYGLLRKVMQKLYVLDDELAEVGCLVSKYSYLLIIITEL